MEQLLPYYEKELGYLRHLSKEFAAKYPKIAGRLQLSGNTSEDPHVERIIESFAFLSARIHHKLDDEFSEITSTFIDTLYPHYLRPIPAMSIVQVNLDKKSQQLSDSSTLPANTVLQTKPIQGVPCKFKTCYPTQIWPVEVTRAALSSHLDIEEQRRWPKASGKLTIELSMLGSQAVFDKLSPKPMRFFLNGNHSVIYQLYQIIFNQSLGGAITQSGSYAEIGHFDKSSIQPVGFNLDEGMLDYDKRSHIAFRLLTEYFSFPEKFLFADIDWLGSIKVWPKDMRTLQLHIYLQDFTENETTTLLMKQISSSFFRLGCTPVVNLFNQATEPIRITHTQTEYPVIPDSRRPKQFEVYAVRSVKLIQKEEQEKISTVPAMYGKRFAEPNESQLYWQTKRRMSNYSIDQGTDVYIALADSQFKPSSNSQQTLSIEAICTNRNIPSFLPFGNPEGDLSIEGGAGLIQNIQFLAKPTKCHRLNNRADRLWRLISHLSLNRLSLLEDGRETLSEILELYNFSDSEFNKKQINGIKKLTAHPSVARVNGNPFPIHVRGLDIQIYFDTQNYVGGGVYLFSAVLERFLGLMSNINGYSRLKAISYSSQKEIAQWPARSGENILA